MIKSKSTYDQIDVDTDGIRILIARFVPKAMREKAKTDWDIHLPCVAPSPELLQLFKNKEVRFPVYAKRFFEEMSSDGAGVGIRTLASLSLLGTVTVLCYEFVDTYCHRRFIKDIVEDVLSRCRFSFENIWRYDVNMSLTRFMEPYARKAEEIEAAQKTKEQDPQATDLHA